MCLFMFPATTKTHIFWSNIVGVRFTFVGCLFEKVFVWSTRFLISCTNFGNKMLPATIEKDMLHLHAFHLSIPGALIYDIVVNCS